MSMRGRIKAVEKNLGIGEDVWTTIIVGCGDGDEVARERAEEAKRRGWRMHVVRVGVRDTAESVEEAQRIVEEHQARGRMSPITVYEKGSHGEELLAEWDPGLPDWISGDDASAVAV